MIASYHRHPKKRHEFQVHATGGHMKVAKIGKTGFF